MSRWRQLPIQWTPILWWQSQFSQKFFTASKCKTNLISELKSGLCYRFESKCKRNIGLQPDQTDCWIVCSYLAACKSFCRFQRHQQFTNHFPIKGALWSFPVNKQVMVTLFLTQAHCSFLNFVIHALESSSSSLSLLTHCSIPCHITTTCWSAEYCETIDGSVCAMSLSCMCVLMCEQEEENRDPLRKTPP